jgi:curved DNA-binding protein CbpA
VSHYDVLGVSPDADSTELHRAYVALARRHHPDRMGGDDVRMRTINEAWAVLGDPARRQQYDLVVRRAARPTPPPTWSARPTGPAYTQYDDLDDLDDDRPVRITVVLPRWLAMVPTGLFAASVVLLFGAMVFGDVVLALAIMCFLLSILLFLASPFVALYASRRENR